ncbi:MAG: sigma-70 family RNA polymerase sigma factor [Clostridia bacterium]|nr:sigma-70 family RNA polymerase sigma factor [Clostridia bacterium]
MLNIIKKIIEKIKMKIAKHNALFYISLGANILPDKLSQDEEQSLACAVQEGNLDARQKLIEHNLRLVVYTAQKFDNTGINMDDLISVGTVGLIKAVGSFKSDKNIKMATYASRCIENEILMFLRKKAKEKREVSLEDPLNTDSDGNELTLSDCLGTPPDEVSKNYDNDIEKQVLKKALSKLNEREMQIMNLRFGLSSDAEELTQKQVADKLNISQSYISRLEKKIIENLKEELMFYLN